MDPLPYFTVPPLISISTPSPLTFLSTMPGSHSKPITSLSFSSSLLLLLLATTTSTTLAKPLSSSSGLFSDPSIVIPESPAAQKLTLRQHPHPDVLHSPGRAAYAKQKGHQQQQKHAIKPKHKKGPKKPAPKPKPPVKGPKGGTGKTTVNTIFSGVYPTVNLTWIGKNGQKQDFVSFVDTGSADTFVVGSNFSCVDIETKVGSSLSILHDALC